MNYSKTLYLCLMATCISSPVYAKFDVIAAPESTLTVKAVAPKIDEQIVRCNAVCHRQGNGLFLSDVQLNVTLPGGVQVTSYRAIYATKETCMDAVTLGGSQTVCYPANDPRHCDFIVINGGNVFTGSVQVPCP